MRKHDIVEDVILYWAHHEKLCLIDGTMAFMGGLDLCFGRWDMYQHPIADAHPTNTKKTVFPGQDYNNARIRDFDNVVQWQENKLNRGASSRMGWSDISVSLFGSCVQDLQQIFVDRWNFLFDKKYCVRGDVRYRTLLQTRSLREEVFSGAQGHQIVQEDATLRQISQSTKIDPSLYHSKLCVNMRSRSLSRIDCKSDLPTAWKVFATPRVDQLRPWERGGRCQCIDTRSRSQDQLFQPLLQRGSRDSGRSWAPLTRQDCGFYSLSSDPATDTRADSGDDPSGPRVREQASVRSSWVDGDSQDRLQQASARSASLEANQDRLAAPLRDPMWCQIVRSSSHWSNGTQTEHSIQSAYINVIEKSQHFIYIENQFFITATGFAQKPVKNQIGKALVDRILRAARAGENYKVIVLIPSIPAFAGDLRDDSSLGTRAIMEFQYNSICRGGHSIMEAIALEGFDPMVYIRFYNLRNYDRINCSGVVRAPRTGAGHVDNAIHKRHNEVMVGSPFTAHNDNGTLRSDQRDSVAEINDAQESSNEGICGSNTTSHSLDITHRFLDGNPPNVQYAQNLRQVASEELASNGNGRWDTVSECYMLGGEDIRNVPWDAPGDVPEIDAFVSEELYIHSKVRIMP